MFIYTCINVNSTTFQTIMTFKLNISININAPSRPSDPYVFIKQPPFYLSLFYVLAETGRYPNFRRE